MAVSRKRSFDVPTEHVDRSILLYCDPADRPYSHRHFHDEWKAADVHRKILRFHPIKYSNAWVLTLKTPEHKQEVLRLGALVVNGAYCSMKDASTPEHLITVHWVPISVTDLTPLQRVFEEYGRVIEVRRVIRQALGWDEYYHTSVKVLMSLGKGVTERDLPYELHMNGMTHLVVVPGRPPFCLKCRGRGHTFVHCHTPKCAACGRWGHKHHKARYGPVEGIEAVRMSSY
ncbi:hypothetical protein MRX96_003085 [Rhipicephalus microplus]|uniref:Uncharacterized protein n=1 Tax=Rhipicephalus microplus TaxID=6941 RepID=A0A9J6EFX1_RHIMP|nr:hypothetical protein HPB51_008191 [Rhipicephalus microplus]